MKLSTTETLAGSEISEILGIARGSSVRARNIAFDIVSRCNRWSTVWISNSCTSHIWNPCIWNGSNP